MTGLTLTLDLDNKPFLAALAVLEAANFSREILEDFVLRLEGGEQFFVFNTDDMPGTGELLIRLEPGDVFRRFMADARTK